MKRKTTSLWISARTPSEEKKIALRLPKTEDYLKGYEFEGFGKRSHKGLKARYRKV